MHPGEFQVDPDIRFATTPPAALYTDPAWFAAVAERVLAPAWHVVARADEIAGKETVLPLTLLPGALDEPLVLARDRKDRVHCVSNVCTHRGNLVACEAGEAKLLRCGYHGRTFRLDGELMGAPGMEGAAGFPSPSDSLARAAVATWGPLVFASLGPATPFEDLVLPLRGRCGHVDFASMRLDGAASADYEIDANWILYVENYLEGFHVPFVHPELAREIDVGAYSVETLPHGAVQTAVVADDAPAFALPAGHANTGRRVGAWYVWLFPATMVNVYPWGASVNVVEPLGPARTRIRFLTFVLDPSLRGRGAGGDLHRVEMQDEAVVRQVQRGLGSRLRRAGRYAPRHEAGVHHFHRMLADRLAAAPR